MPRDIGEWLDGLGLGRYSQAFAENEIDLQALPHITEEDLKDIGVALGARRKLIAAIAKFGDLDDSTIGNKKPDHEFVGVEAERRHLTVMFADLVGSTALAERLDPEDLREVIRAYQETCAEAVTRYEGYVAKYIGDGLLIYFGYPLAHEDDARRAVSAGLGIVEGIGGLNQRLAEDQGVELGVRVGIHTGLVVTGEMGGGTTREADAIVGETPNIAARLEGLAKPNSVAMSAATHALVEGLFECDDLGAQKLKGVSKPVRVYVPRRESAAPSRFEAAAEHGLSPLVGRQDEVGLLMRTWSRASTGASQVVLVSGEAGVGKSRLLRAMYARLEDRPHSRVTWFGSPYHQQSAFHVVVDQLRRVLRVGSGEASRQSIARLEGMLSSVTLNIGEHAPVFAALLALPTGEEYPRLELTPAQFKQKVFASSIELLRSMAARQPVLLAVEDAQLVDPSTLELLSHMIERLSAAPILFVVTFRPEFEPSWKGRENAELLPLSRLDQEGSMALAISAAGGKRMPEDLVRQIAARADGVPLFIEELTKSVVETGIAEVAPGSDRTGASVPRHAIPESLQDSLTARLDRLGSVKEVAQLAATLGRTFSRDVLAAVSPLDGTQLDRALERLVAADLLRGLGPTPTVRFEFKHALIRDAAYQSLLKKRRRQFHRTIAHALESDYPEITGAEPELLARHYAEAGLGDRAIDYWCRAGRRAVEQSANLEAISHFSNALDLINAAPERRAHGTTALEIYLGLGPALMMTKGIASTEAEEAYTRARELSRALGDDQALFAATWGLWFLFEQRNRTDLSHDLALEAIEVANRVAEPEFLIEANHTAWTTTYNRGKIQECFNFCEDSISRYHPEEHRRLAYRYAGHDPGVCALVHSALSHWTLGYPDTAQSRCERALKSARDFGHVPTIILSSFGNAVLRVYIREPQSVIDAAQDFAAVCEKVGIAQYLALAKLMLGWGRIHSGEGAEAIGDMIDGLATFDATGARLRRSLYLTHIADALLWLGDVPRGLERIGDAIEFLDEHGEFGWAAYTYQVQGDLLAQAESADASAAETSFNQAIAIARKQNAKIFELRATISLARLWRKQGKTIDACALLSSIHGWFTEGFDTPDLKDAKALLDELS